MKRLIFLIVITAASVLSYAQAERSKHEAYFSCGTSPQVHIPTPEFPLPPSEVKEYRGVRDKKISGTINIGYVYHITTPFALGIQYSYDRVKGNVIDNISNKLGEMKNNCHTIMMTFKYDWLNTGRFKFYTRAAAGVMKIDGNLSSDNKILKPTYESAYFDKKIFAWQVSPVGLDWTYNKNIGFFMEDGIGYSGCAIAGIRVFL